MENEKYEEQIGTLEEKMAQVRLRVKELAEYQVKIKSNQEDILGRLKSCEDDLAIDADGDGVPDIKQIHSKPQVSVASISQLRQSVELLLRHFEPPKLAASSDTFAFSSQITALQSQLEDTKYKVEKSVDEVHEIARIKKSESPLEVNEDWHAEVT